MNILSININFEAVETIINKILTSRLFSASLIALAAYFLQTLAMYSMKKILDKKSLSSRADDKRFVTLLKLFTSITKYVIFTIAVLGILSIYGVNVSAILAGLGVVGFVVGLALQDALKDLFAGLFIIMDNQFFVGDNVAINGFRGDVIELGLKSTRIKSYTGEVRIISNRTIDELINYSMASSSAIVDIKLDYSLDVNDFINMIKDDIDRYCTNNQVVLKDAVFNGVQEVNESNYVYRISIETLPNENFQVRRDIQRIIMEKIKDKLGSTKVVVVSE